MAKQTGPGQKYYLTQFPKVRDGENLRSLASPLNNQISVNLEDIYDQLDLGQIVKGQDSLVIEVQQKEIELLSEFIKTNAGKIGAEIKQKFETIDQLPKDNCENSILIRHNFLNDINEKIIRASIRMDHGEFRVTGITRFTKKVLNDPMLKEYWPSLNFIGLYSTNINFLPKDIGKLTGLKEVHIKFNQFLTHLPETIKGWNQVCLLYIDHNRLIELPACLGELPSLFAIDLSSNCLEKIPASISQLTLDTEIDGTGEIGTWRVLYDSNNCQQMTAEKVLATQLELTTKNKLKT